MDILARYYTQEKISELLIKQFHLDKPSNILELGIGDGALTKAASMRWREARFLGVDIDDVSVKLIKNELPFVNVIRHDSLLHNFQIKLNIKHASIDIAICNPPYLKHEITYLDRKLFKSVNLDSCIYNKHITTDIIFLAQNLFYLKDGCELGIILPDSIITNHYYSRLRMDLLKNHQVKAIIQLPDNVFNKTEARTHILILKKNKKSKQFIEVSKANYDGQITKSLYVEQKKLIQRMDFDFHNWQYSSLHTKNTFKLEDVYKSAIRGNKSKKYLSELKIPYFHTTSFSNFNGKIILDSELDDIPENLTIAAPGDILVARVGKRCIGKVAIVEKGFVPISDCVYRIRVKDKYIQKTYEAFKSNEGQQWFQAYGHGVCARVISKVDLLKFKIKTDSF